MSHTPFIKEPSAEGKEKHVPVIKVADNAVTVVVGDDVAHPNTEAHYIAWLELYGEKKEGGQVVQLGRAAITAALTDPRATFQTTGLGDFSKLHALSYCNLHGVWANTLAL